MIKLNRHYESLEKVVEKLKDKIKELEEKQEKIEENADEQGRDMTTSELERWDKYADEIYYLETQLEDVENAMNYLIEYTDKYAC